MNIFDRAERMASRAVDRVNGQRFRLTPMAGGGNERRRLDESREIVNGIGVFDYASVERGLQLGVRKSYREANDFRLQQVSREPLLSVDRREFLGSLPRQGDVVQVFDEPGDPTFDVVSAQPDGHSRIALKLSTRANT